MVARGVSPWYAAPFTLSPFPLFPRAAVPAARGNRGKAQGGANHGLPTVAIPQGGTYPSGVVRPRRTTRQFRRSEAPTFATTIRACRLIRYPDPKQTRAAPERGA